MLTFGQTPTSNKVGSGQVISVPPSLPSALSLVESWESFWVGSMRSYTHTGRPGKPNGNRIKRALQQYFLKNPWAYAELLV